MRLHLPRRLRDVSWLIAMELLLVQSLGKPPQDSEAARRYSPAMAMCMAALSKLAYCKLEPENAAVALDQCCSMPCREWAGLELEPGGRLLSQSSQGVDYGFVAKFTRSKEANPESMPASGCIVVLNGAEDDDAKSIAKGSSALADDSSLHRLEVWQSDDICPNCKVSALWKRAWEKLRPRIIDRLMDEGCKPTETPCKGCEPTTESPVFVTGHSHGAALATLAMFGLNAQDSFAVETSYNFESPRVGNEDFVRAFNHRFASLETPETLFRVTHGSDRVPRQPRREHGYSHAGNQVWYHGDDSDAKFVVCGNATADPHCGVDSLPRNKTCPLKQSECPNATCDASCTGFAPEGGAHCAHPLAPARSFCDFAGNGTENWGSEWNEVVKKGDEIIAWEKSCHWGPRPKTHKSKAHKTHKTHKSKADAASQEKKDAGHSNAEEPETDSEDEQEDKTSDFPEDEMHTVSCLKKDTFYQPLDMTGHPYTLESDSRGCQIRCGFIDDCMYFSVYPRGDGSFDCHVADGNATQGPAIGFTSGPRSCGAEKKKLMYLKFLSGGFPNSGPGGGPRWYFPGLAAAGALLTYFVCLAGLAMSTRLRPGDSRLTGREAEKDVAPVTKDAMVPMLQATDADDVDNKAVIPSMMAEVYMEDAAGHSSDEQLTQAI